MQIVIDMPEDVYKRTVFYREFKDLNDCVTTIKALEKAVPLPKGHERLTDEEQNNLWMYMIFNKDKIKTKTEQWTKEAEEVGMTLTEYLESINPLNNNNGELSWLGKSCKDCGNEKCKKLGTLPKGYDCALWQPKSEER